MGLLETAQKGAQTAFNVAWEFTRLVDVILLTRVVPPLGEPPDPNLAPKYTSLPAFYYQTFSQKTVSETSLRTATFLILAQDIEAQGFTGLIVDGDLVDDLTTGFQWGVDRADLDPADATWALQCSR
jgi:hypothetical protein